MSSDVSNRAESRERSVGAMLVHGSAWNAAAQLTPVVINLVLTPFLIHGIGVDQYGLYALAATITIFLSSFDGGIGTTAQRFFSLYAGRDDRVTSTRLLWTLALIILVAGGAVSAADWLLSPLIAAVFHMPHRFRGEAIFLLRTFGVLITVSLLHNLFVSLLQARQRFALTSKATIASYLAWAAGLYLTVRAHYGLRGIALSLVAEQLLATVVILPSALPYLSKRSLHPLPLSDMRQFFGYALKVQTTGITTLVNMQFDALLIGALLPVRYVGLYSPGANVATQFRYVATSVLPPGFTRLANVFGKSGEQATQRETVRLQRLWVIATTGWCAAGLGAAYFCVLAWLGPHFRLSALVAVILLAGYTVNLFGGVLTAHTTAIGKPGIETRYGVVGMIINIVLTIPLAIFAGVLGIVGATALGQVIGSLYLLRVARSQLEVPVPSFLREIPVLRGLACMGLTAALELVTYPVAPTGPLGLLLCAVPALIGLGFYAVSFLGPRKAIGVLRSVLAGRSPLELLSI